MFKTEKVQNRERAAAPFFFQGLVGLLFRVHKFFYVIFTQHKLLIGIIFHRKVNDRVSVPFSIPVIFSYFMKLYTDIL